MLRLNILPNFKLADADGHERPFDDFLVDFNVILVTHTREACYGSADELLRSFLAEARCGGNASVHGIEIRSHDAYCRNCCGPHLVFQGRELITICGSWIRRLWGLDSDAWIMIVNRGMNVLDDGPLSQIERLAMQFGLDVALSPHRIARAPPQRGRQGRRDTGA